MNDTPDIVARVVAERYRDLTPAELLPMATDMYATAESTEAQVTAICRAWAE